ncbi:MAG: universal stress protein [Halofilum sp. (in: g-proteobacteria)]|nr:universal stress protein [Halofilum sp. (in: g-proteobacteria)]
MVRNILVPIDGSIHAQRALELAADLAARHEARLHVMHVLLRGDVPEELRALSERKDEREPAIAIGAGFVDASLPAEVLKDIATQLLERAEATAREHGAGAVETSWHEGDPARAILEQAREQGADMIVMGSRGLSDLEGLVVGSVSHKIAHLFEGSVVSVR